MEVAGCDIADGFDGDAVGPWPVPGSQSGAHRAVPERQQFRAGRVGDTGALGGEHTGLPFHPVQRQCGQRLADPGEELRYLHCAPRGGEVREGERDRRVVVVVEPRQRTHRQVLDEMSHSQTPERLVAHPAPEYEGSFERAWSLRPQNRNVINHITMHGRIILSTHATADRLLSPGPEHGPRPDGEDGGAELGEGGRSWASSASPDMSSLVTDLVTHAAPDGIDLGFREGLRANPRLSQSSVTARGLPRFLAVRTYASWGTTPCPNRS